MPADSRRAAERWVCLDVGETLIDETRAWGHWADELGVPRLTLFAMLGASIARGDDHRAVFRRLGLDDWRARWPRVEAAYGGFRAEDLYPDALRALGALGDAGYRTAVLANQPAKRHEELLALGVRPVVMAMSDAIGVSKPDAAFFERALDLLGRPDPAVVAYVGDRLDNDVAPSRAAGMRAIWIRRGPWGRIPDLPNGTGRSPHLVVDSLDELVARLPEAWPA